MANKGNIVRWITVKGRRIPIYEDGSMGGFMEGKQESSKKEVSSKQSKAAELARRQLIFDKPGNAAEIAADNWRKIVGVSNERMAEIMSEQDPKYEYEASSEKDGNYIHHYMHRIPKEGSKKESKSLEDHSDIQRIAEEHVKKIWNGGAANRELYDAAEKWAEEHNFDKTKAKDAAFAAMNKKQMAEIKKREGSKYATPEQKERVENAKDLIKHYMDQGKSLEEAKELAYRVKGDKSIKVGDKEVKVKKDKSMDDIFENRTTTRGTTPGMINTMSSTALRTQLRKAGVSSADMKGKDTEELRRMLLAIYKKR